METSPQLPAVIPQTGAVLALPDTVAFMPVLSPVEMLARRKELIEVVKNILKDGEHFGKTPGTNKPSLFKPGAEILNQYFGLYAEFEVTSRVEKWEPKPELFDYEFKCTIRSKRDQVKVSEGVGSCNSYESRYRYRDAKRSCPGCGRVGTIIKGKEEFGGGWVCWAKDQTNCCKAKFKDNDPSIVGQALGKVDNEDIASLKNTILKMAAKRAYVDATLKATGASEIFTQDTEDLPFQVEIITAEVVEVAAQKQNEQREAARGAKSEPQQDFSPTADRIPSQQEVAEKKSESVTNASQGKEQGTAASPAKQNAPASTATQAPAQNKPGSTGGANKVTREEMGKLLAAGEKNGWKQIDISNFVCFAFKMDPKTIAQKFTQEQYKIALGLLSHEKNANGRVLVNAKGASLPLEHQWPPKQ